MSPRKNAGPTLRGAALEPYTPGGTKRTMRVGGEPEKTAGPTLRGAALEPYTPGGTKRTLRVGGEPQENRGSHTARSGHGAAHSRRDPELGWRAAFNLEKVVMGVLAK